MRKNLAMIYLLISCSFYSFSQQRNWDKPMQLKNCSIQIEANLFTATTFIELEFYNPNNQEIEGLYQFRLQPGQAITAFQLDLNGKYRDGSIEEKWKARNAYNTIVGKRIDPALLQMDYENNYSLRIYPFAPKGTRRVTMTIQEVLKAGKESLEYNLPLNFKDTVSNFSSAIKIYNAYSLPYSKSGLLAYKPFSGNNQTRELNYSTQDIFLKQSLSFYIPIWNKDNNCVKTTNGNSYFALRHISSVPKKYAIPLKNVLVYWDISASGAKRNINKEINFLKQYISFNNVDHITIAAFNHNLQQTVSFATNDTDNKWVSLIKSLEYDGATQIGTIDLSNKTADAVLLFTDGYNSYGRNIPKGNNNYLFTVHASSQIDRNNLAAIVGKSGGRDIDLEKLTISQAVQAAGVAEIVVMNVSSSSGKAIINLEEHSNVHESLVAGILQGDGDTIVFQYGNHNKTFATEKVYVDGKVQCGNSAIDRIPALFQFNSIIKGYNWQATLAFGRDEKIVTPNTSFIVLERVEDYVRFNIEPPEELEKECEEKGYVKRNKENDFKLYNSLSEQEILNGVIANYNQRIRRWSSSEGLITLSTSEGKEQKAVKDQSEVSQGSAATLNGAALGIDASTKLEEVVVVGYGVARKSSITGAITTVRSNDIFSSATSVEQVLSGRVAGLSVTPINNSFLSEPSSIRIRGISSLNNNQPLFVLDGVPVSGNINDLVSVHNIENITVLKDAAATAMYGSRGANGVIVIQTKRGSNSYYNYRNQRPYKLKDQEDVEYLQEITEVSKNEKFTKYKELQAVYGNEAGFYLDIAIHFFELGYTSEALNILSNAAEVSSGNLIVLKAMAFVLEKHKQYGEAIKLYEHIFSSSPDLKIYRDLALALYQNKNYQNAIDLLYQGITKSFPASESANISLKSIMLNELNAIAIIHKDELDLSHIKSEVLKTLPVDLRIVVDANYNIGNEINITEPGGKVCTPNASSTKNGGYITNDYFNQGLTEYQIKTAVKGKYKINIQHRDYHGYAPFFIKITTFKNFGKPNQTMEIENVIMDNQNGSIEIGEVKW